MYYLATIFQPLWTINPYRKSTWSWKNSTFIHIHRLKQNSSYTGWHSHNRSVSQPMGLDLMLIKQDWWNISNSYYLYFISVVLKYWIKSVVLFVSKQFDVINHRITIKDVHYPHTDKHIHIAFISNKQEKMSHPLNGKALELDKDNNWQNDIIRIILQSFFIQKSCIFCKPGFSKTVQVNQITGEHKLLNTGDISKSEHILPTTSSQKETYNFTICKQWHSEKKKGWWCRYSTVHANQVPKAISLHASLINAHSMNRILLSFISKKP